MVYQAISTRLMIYNYNHKCEKKFKFISHFLFIYAQLRHVLENNSINQMFTLGDQNITTLTFKTQSTEQTTENIEHKIQSTENLEPRTKNLKYTPYVLHLIS